MKGFLLETEVVSSLVAPRRDGFEQLMAWLEQRDREGLMFLSVVAIHEIQKGVALLQHKSATAKASALEIGLTGIRVGYADGSLEFDVKAAEASGKTAARVLAAGHSPGMANSTVAGIAKAHGLVAETHNFKHFRPFGISAVFPTEAAKT